MSAEQELREAHQRLLRAALDSESPGGVWELALTRAALGRLLAPIPDRYLNAAAGDGRPEVEAYRAWVMGGDE